MNDRTPKTIADLIAVMAALRTPVTGCPWDLEQSFATIAPYTIEEAYEVADAIARRDLADLKEELGDLLLQVVYHARLAEEEGAFGFDDVVDAIVTKMVRRHPHVFGDESARSAGAAKGWWERIKAEEKAEKAAKAAGSPPPGGEGSGVGGTTGSRISTEYQPVQPTYAQTTTRPRSGSRVRKPSLDDMGPGTDRPEPLRDPKIDPRAKAGAFGEGVSGPHKPTLDEMGPHAERGLPVGGKPLPPKPTRTIDVPDTMVQKGKRRGRPKKTGRPGQ